MGTTPFGVVLGAGGGAEANLALPDAIPNEGPYVVTVSSLVALRVSLDPLERAVKFAIRGPAS